MNSRITKATKISQGSQRFGVQSFPSTFLVHLFDIRHSLDLLVLLLVSIIFLLLYSFLIFFYLKEWKAAATYSSQNGFSPVFISVIVPARNEAGRISHLLNAIKKQDYPLQFFELIVVDDYSTDGTTSVVNEQDLSNCLLIQPKVEEKDSSKKKAIEAGIHQAKGELIVTTDADCVPGSSWLSTIASFYRKHDASLIAAPVKFSYDHSFLQVFQAIDFLVLQGITAASVSSNFHNMCNGANLAYKKQSFIDVNGFEGIDQVATGDDMLLMHKIWKKEPAKVFYLKSREAIVSTEPMPRWKDFFMQRKRWASKTFIYDDNRIIYVLGFVYFFNCLFFVLLCASFLNPFNWCLLAGYLVLKTLIELPFVSSVADFYNEKKLLRYFLFFQPVHIFYTVYTGLSSQLGKYEWKGRRSK